MRFVSYLVVVVLVGLGGLHPAQAADGASSPDAGKTALDDANRAEAANHLYQAIEALKKAYELTGDTSLLFRLGNLTAKIGQEVPAIRFYRAYLTRDPHGKYRAAAEQQVRLLEDHQQLSGGIDRDGTPRTVAPATIPAATAKASGSAPTAAVLHEDTRANTAPAPRTLAATDLALTPGATSNASAAPAVDLRAEPAPAPSDTVEPPLPRWLPWVGLAATAGLGTVAALSGLAASHRYDELRSSCGATSAGCSDAQIDDVRARARKANLLWIGAGVMAAATGVSVYANTHEAGFSGIWRF